MAEAAPTNSAPQEQGTNWSSILFRILMVYLLINVVFKQKGSQPQVDRETGKTLPPITNTFPPGQFFSLKVWLTETNATFDQFDSPPIWIEKGMHYLNSQDLERTKQIDIPMTEHLANNGSLFAHIFFFKDSSSPNPKSPRYDPTSSFYRVHQLNKYALKKAEKIKKNLLSAEEEKVQVEITPDVSKIISYWKPNLTVHLIEDPTAYAPGSIPPQMLDHFVLTADQSAYYPVLYVDEFWLLSDQLIPINDTLSSLPLHLSYSAMSLMKWQLMMQFDQSLSLHQQIGTQTEAEGEEFKRMILETNPYLLGITMIVTILHSVFDFLAFKNDISFWRNKKSLEGLSVRTLLINSISQTIIFLYLLDNETSWMIIISCAIGVLIEYWKLHKAMILSIEWKQIKLFGQNLGTIPWLKMEDRESYASETKKYDEEAMRYLSYVLFPLILCYAVYSVVYDSHKSWYSFILGTLVGCVYTFGFITMTPQLFINWKMKSVAHLPWKTFMYKALNTFIDDLFAFIIKMPTLHRLSCFRDDIIFLIFLYQRWIYPVDKKRVNEFGQGGEDDAKPSGPEPSDAAKKKPKDD